MKNSIHSPIRPRPKLWALFAAFLAIAPLAGRAQSTSPPPDLPRRVLNFPPGRKSGELLIRPARARTEDAWSYLGVARGEVSIPEGHEASFHPLYHGPGTLSVLLSLGPDDLQEISLKSRPVVDADLADLARLTGLRSLNIAHTRITGEGLAYLSALAQLERLYAESAPLDDAAGPHLAALHGLRMLDLSYTKMSDQGLVWLLRADRLESLMLYGMSITTDSLAAIRNCDNLAELGLPRHLLSDSGIQLLARLPKLERLYAYGGIVGNGGIATLAAFGQLRELHLAAPRLTDAALGSLARLTQLKTLALYETKITPGGFERLSRKLPGCTLIR